MSREAPDLLVVGAGAGGLAAARAGVRAGLRTVMVTAGPVGGDCTFTGCVPSKTLIEAAARGEDSAAALDRVRATVARVAATETADVLRGEGVDVVEGWACFVAPGAVRVDVPSRDGAAGVRHLDAARVVLATGARPRVPAIVGLDELHGEGEGEGGGGAGDGGGLVLTSETVFDLPAAPASLAVLGGGPVGCELAQAFARLGSQVTLVQSAPRLLPAEDPDVGDLLAGVLRREGVRVLLGARVGEVARVDGRVGVVTDDTAVTADTDDTDDTDPIEVERLLLATGRRPDTAGLGLDAAGIARGDRGEVVVDQHLATTAPGVWAVGDATGVSPYTHAADEMGRLAVRNATSSSWRRSRFDPGLVPHVTFTEPEVASVGLGEAAAADAHGDRAWVAHLPMTGVDRAVAADRTDGFVRIVAGPQPGLGPLARGGLAAQGGGRVLGATIVAERAGEMLAEIALVMRMGAVTGRLAQTVHAYPTWSLAVRQAAAALATGDGSARRARPRPPEAP